MDITHYDLFAGIGGFSLALEEVFNEAKINHIFCEWAEFPTAVFKALAERNILWRHRRPCCRH
ncbi:hypothetical protein C4668_24675 [Salmonella enterica subsp. enterica serovar Anatum]|nr:hypothetical protein C4668_24675 [Salmonella enterica subsp. enterica serovar Anatum]